MMSLRVAHIPYLNAAPFYTTLAAQPDITLHRGVPRQLGQLARDGRIDAGPMAVADWFRRDDTFEMVDDLGIATHRAARSVLVFSKQPFQELQNRIVAVTEDTSTSMQLLRVLLEERYHVQPATYVQTDAPDAHDARLLIGDAALTQYATQTRRNPFVTDLGAEWWEWTLLPFVFAVWVIRTECSAEQKAAFRRALHASLSAGMQHYPAIAEHAASSLQLPAKELESYLGNFTYTLGPREHEGLNRFRAIVLEREGVER